MAGKKSPVMEKLLPQLPVEREVPRNSVIISAGLNKPKNKHKDFSGRVRMRREGEAVYGLLV